MKILLLLLAIGYTASAQVSQVAEQVIGAVDVPSTPVDSPGAGTYSSTQSVTLTDATATVIYYSLSTTPNCTGTGTLYTGAFNISTTSTLQAIGCNGITGGGVLTSVYTINLSYNCGETVSSGATAQSGQDNKLFFIPCTTGSDASGYAVTSLNVLIGTLGTGTPKVYTALYQNTTSSCFGSAANCPSTTFCSDTVGVNLTASQFNVITLSTVTTSCGIIPANTTFWIAYSVVDGNNATQINYQSANCPAPLAFTSHAYFLGGTAGVWPTASATAQNAGVCYVAYAVLAPQ